MRPIRERIKGQKQPVISSRKKLASPRRYLKLSTQFMSKLFNYFPERKLPVENDTLNKVSREEIIKPKLKNVFNKAQKQLMERNVVNLEIRKKKMLNCQQDTTT